MARNSSLADAQSALDADLHVYTQRAAARPPLACPPSWRNYAAAAGASISMAGAAHAGVVHTAPPTPLTAQAGAAQSFDAVFVDIDGDGATDAQFQAAAQAGSVFQGANIIGLASGGGGLAANAGSLQPLLAGSLIDGNLSFTPQALGVAYSSIRSTFSGSPGTYSGGMFLSDSGVAGVQFNRSGQTHFAWIRINVEVSSQDPLALIEILEWAYEDRPGVAIEAGATSGGVPQPGDYDRDGDIDTDDYAKWKSDFGLFVQEPGDGADGNADGVVNAADYAAWRDNLPGAGAAQSAPEPSSLALGVLALGAAGVRALRRQQIAE